MQATMLAGNEYTAAQRANERAEIAEEKVAGVLDHSAQALGNMQAQASQGLRIIRFSARA